MSANKEAVGTLHELVTDIMTKAAECMLEDMQRDADSDFPATLPSPQLLQSMVKFLKDNDVVAEDTALKKVSTAVSQLKAVSGRGRERLGG